MMVDQEQKIVKLLPFTSLSLMLIGPLLYEYAFQFFNADQTKLFVQKKRYIPFVLFSVLLAISYLFLSEQVYGFILLAAISFSFIYLIYHLVILIRYQIKSSGKLKYFYATIKDKNLYWINILIVGLMIVVILDIALGAYIASFGVQWIPILNTSALVALIWYFGFYGLGQQEIINNVHEFEIPKEHDKDEDLCSTSEYLGLKNKLNTLIKEKELYKIEELNLNLLSNYLETTEKKTSYLLNQCMDTNFYELINGFRLEAFKSKIIRGELKEKTMLALAMDSGFKSKASFNRIFKQKNGISPSAYAKNVRTPTK